APHNLHSFPTRRSSDLSLSLGLTRLLKSSPPRRVSVVGLMMRSCAEPRRLTYALFMVTFPTFTVTKAMSWASVPVPTERSPFVRSEEHTSELQSPDHLV